MTNESNFPTKGQIKKIKIEINLPFYIAPLGCSGAPHFEYQRGEVC